ncbi:MAG: BadF/BadG/BcrA/BcrD ATPase family protein [Ignavibacteriaceae bacterium]|nr:BadF/BadG/BcrA/BcrD ATPase family protein [Ignavibacteriaceae bacterium]
MKYFIGIDGGGTKTDCIITDENCNQLFAIKGGPLNLLAATPSESSDTILKLINSCLLNLDITLTQLNCIGVGAAGAGRSENSEKLGNNLNALLQNSVKLRVFTDAEAALEGAFNGKPGCILISGTGSIIFGKDQSGIIHRCGGYGKILGDEGSGYMLGKKALITAAKQFDARNEKSLLTELLKDKYQIQSVQDILNEVYNNKLDISSIAPIVLASAGNNDKVSLRIIDEETNELLLLISCMKKKLEQENFDISFGGKLLSTRNIFSDTLKSKLANSYKWVKIKEPEYSPAMGAVFIAKKK